MSLRKYIGDPRLMRISLLRFLKSFQKKLAYAFFEQIHFIIEIFWLIWVQKSHKWNK